MCDRFSACGVRKGVGRGEDADNNCVVPVNVKGEEPTLADCDLATKKGGLGAAGGSW